jgi:hypothetical protein
MTVSQIDPDTSTLVFSTYFGPTAGNLPPGSASFMGLFPADIEVDSAGNIVVIGTVNSMSYPTLNATQANLSVPQNTAQFRNGSDDSGVNDLFVTKLDPVSPGIVFSTFFGGSQAESGFPSLTIDASNNIYVASWTHSTDHPLLNALQVSLQVTAILHWPVQPSRRWLFRLTSVAPPTSSSRLRVGWRSCVGKIILVRRASC